MKYYAIYNEETQELSKAQCKQLNAINIEISEEVYNNFDHYTYIDGKIVIDEEYDIKQEAKERERINALTVTKRVFALALQELGISYNELKQLIATNEQAQLEWDLCVELQRGNPLLDIMASTMGITPAILDYIFRKANGEDVELTPNTEVIGS